MNRPPFKRERSAPFPSGIPRENPRLSRLLEATIREVLAVFRMVLDPAVLHSAPGGYYSRADLTVISGFTGDVQGVLCMHSSTDLAFEIASKNMGREIQEFDAYVRELLEEIGGAVASHFRAKLQNMGCVCSFSPPAVISGSEYHFHSTPRSQYVECAVTAGGIPIWMTLGLRRP
jgi:CheY-specific phosphatase CheX